MLIISPTLEIAEDDLSEAFVRSPGAGGQNVNKVATAVQLRFSARRCRGLSNAEFLRLQVLAGQRMNLEGVVQITASSFRTQERNRADARERLKALILQALVPPKPRRPTKPSKNAKAKRVDVKKRKSAVKKMRGRVGRDD